METAPLETIDFRVHLRTPHMLKHRCLFGTDYPLVDFKDGIAAWSDALRPEVRSLFFNENAVRCLTVPPVE